jgi:putative endonuclease
MRDYYVYILTNWTNAVMYVGVTNDLDRRIAEHKSGTIPGFTQRYNLKKLVYYERSSDVSAAIAREKQIKGWRREKKNALVEAMNPQWHDLDQLEQAPPSSG